LDRMKDDFISTVTHELRTPLTSIRAFSEILHDNPDLDPAERQRFLGLVIKESERLTRLINQVLDLAKLESGLAEWRTDDVDVRVAEPDAATVRVDVIDNGVGISREHQQVIFEKFRQVGDTLTQKPAGTGLGLAICRQIVSRLGGRLWVESEPGRGSTFSFTL